jgi:hypothetical protein
MYETKGIKARSKRIKNASGKLLRRNTQVERREKGHAQLVIGVGNTFKNSYQDMAVKITEQIEHELKRAPVLTFKVKEEVVIPDLEIKRLSLLKGLRQLKDNGLLSGFLRNLFFQSKRRKLSQDQVLAGHRILNEKLDFMMGVKNGNNREN